MSNKNVHTEHCCCKHGCKYGNEDCPVFLGVQKQSFPCENCEDDLETEEKSLDMIKYLSKKIINRFVVIDTEATNIPMGGRVLNEEELGEFIFYTLKDK